MAILKSSSFSYFVLHRRRCSSTSTTTTTSRSSSSSSSYSSVMIWNWNWLRLVMMMLWTLFWPSIIPFPEVTGTAVGLATHGNQQKVPPPTQFQTSQSSFGTMMTGTIPSFVTLVTHGPSGHWSPAHSPTSSRDFYPSWNDTTRAVPGPGGSSFSFSSVGVTKLATVTTTRTTERPKSSTGGGGANPNKPAYSVFQMILIATIAVCLFVMTVLGNILVMVSFKIDKQLQTISNYFLFSLAVADFIIGLISMPLFTVYLLMGQWPFGPAICDAWLALDYLASNASVLNLLIISFDRYFSVTRPLTYRARRTTRRAAVMISSAWGISLILWPPWIYAWPYIEGKKTVPAHECYIQFIETNHYITFGTALAAFYVPVSIMLFLYWKIWRETEKRQRDLSQLQAGKKDSSRRSNSSDEAVDVEEWKRMRSESCICQDHLDTVTSCPAHRQKPCLPRWCAKRWHCIAELCQAFVRFCRVDRDEGELEDVEDEHASPGGCGTPASIETPLQSSVSRCTSLNVIRDPLAQTPTRRTDSVVSAVQSTQLSSVPTGSNGKLPDSQSVYTILIRIPGETEGKNASIRMIQEPGPLPPLPIHAKAKIVSSNPDYVRPGSPGVVAGGGVVGRRQSSAIPKLISKQSATGKGSTTTLSGTTTTVIPIVQAQPKRKKKKNQEKKQEKKAAKTLSAILLAFIVTWTPYNILVLLRTVLSDDYAIPTVLWDMPPFVELM